MDTTRALVNFQELDMLAVAMEVKAIQEYAAKDISTLTTVKFYALQN